MPLVCLWPPLFTAFFRPRLMRHGRRTVFAASREARDGKDPWAA
ncbi:hypothetical protein B4113_2330 [Geobacillus sp. B4113_201601]|nr:hypothetical protein B4113_2330 [Geobacillus sp. B4113_201601]